MKCVDQGQKNFWIPETKFVFLPPPPPQHVKEAACKRLVLPILEYGGSVWILNGLNGKLENVQNVQLGL